MSFLESLNAKLQKTRGICKVIHEGTNDVKRARKHVLIQEYELFKMQQEESIAEAKKRFTHIFNHLIGLGKEFDKEELNIKVLSVLKGVGNLRSRPSQNQGIYPL